MGFGHTQCPVTRWLPVNRWSKATNAAQQLQPSCQQVCDIWVQQKLYLCSSKKIQNGIGRFLNLFQSFFICYDRISAKIDVCTESSAHLGMIINFWSHTRLIKRLNPLCDLVFTISSGRCEICKQFCESIQWLLFNSGLMSTATLWTLIVLNRGVTVWFYESSATLSRLP